MASRVCAEPGCPVLVDRRAYRGLCDQHRRARDKARGNRTQRGYGASVWASPLGTMTYDRCRAEYVLLMTTGRHLDCACGCGQPVDPKRFDLGHDDDRTRIVGPMRPECNRSLAGRASHRR